jgi:tRNA-dihydrouridine synthase A
MKMLDHRFCVAPMMDCSDRHDRYLLRLFSQHVVLYTEMVPVQALLNGDRSRFLQHDIAEHPVALQLGGSDPLEMADCAQLGEEAGFDEININVGCPSSRVQAGRFGVCLMLEPSRVAQCFYMMQDRIGIPVTVKCRIGVDQQDTFDDLRQFIEQLTVVGCRTFIVHARKAWLSGLSPRQNREIPPLQYELVYRLKDEFPELEIIVNGGIRFLSEVNQHLRFTDGVMVGREAYRNPSMLSGIDQQLFGSALPEPARRKVLELYKQYIQRELSGGTPLKQMTRHILGLFQGEPGARAWRRHLSCFAPIAGAGLEVIDEAQSHLQKAIEGSTSGTRESETMNRNLAVITVEDPPPQ